MTGCDEDGDEESALETGSACRGYWQSWLTKTEGSTLAEQMPRYLIEITLAKTYPLQPSIFHLLSGDISNERCEAYSENRRRLSGDVEKRA